MNAAEYIIRYEHGKNKKQWFDRQCEQMIENKKKARLEWLRTVKPEDAERYGEIRREGNKLCKRKRRELVENTITEIENECKKNTMPSYRYLEDHKGKNSTAPTIEEDKWIYILAMKITLFHLFHGSYFVNELVANKYHVSV